MSAQQTIIQQDNDRIQRLIDQLNEAEDKRSSAYHTGQGIEIAEMMVSQAAVELALHVRSLWEAGGYRLTRPETTKG